MKSRDWQGEGTVYNDYKYIYCKYMCINRVSMFGNQTLKTDLSVGKNLWPFDAWEGGSQLA